MTAVQRRLFDRSAERLPSSLLLASQQVLDHELVQRLIIPVRNQLRRTAFIKRADFLDQPQKSPAAVLQVLHPMLHARRAERMHIEANILSVAAVLIALQHAYLIKGAPQIIARKRLVLVELQPVL